MNCPHYLSALSIDSSRDGRPVEADPFISQRVTLVHRNDAATEATEVIASSKARPGQYVILVVGVLPISQSAVAASHR